MESLGFCYDGDYEEIYKQIAKETNTQNPVFVSEFPENRPGNPQYGQKPTKKLFVTTLREAFRMYEKYLFVRANIQNLTYQYLQDEEVAFKNAALLLTKNFY